MILLLLLIISGNQPGETYPPPLKEYRQELEREGLIINTVSPLLLPVTRGWNLRHEIMSVTLHSKKLRHGCLPKFRGVIKWD